MSDSPPSSPSHTVRVKRTIRVGKANDTRLVGPNQTVTLPHAMAQSLIERGVVEALASVSAPDSVSDVESVSTSSSTIDTPTMLSEKLDALVDALLDGMPALSPDDLDRSGKPTVKALEHMIDASVSAAERDQAWQVYQSLVDSA